MRPAAAAALVLALLAGCTGTPRGDAGFDPATAPLLYAASRDGNMDIFIRDAHGNEHNLSRDPAVDNWPAGSPDGTRIVFQSKRSGNLDIWIMDADGRNPVQLTLDPEPDYLPSFSPDGQSIVFTSWRHAPDEPRAPHVYRMAIDGSTPQRVVAESLATSSAARFSPDGKTLVYARGIGEGADLFRFDMATGAETRLTEDAGDGVYHGAPAWSPDGRWIAAYSDQGGNAALSVFAADGSSRRVVLAEGHNWYPDWSPDGQWLVFTRKQPGNDGEAIDIAAVAVDGVSPAFDLVSQPGREQEASWWTPSRPMR